MENIEKKSHERILDIILDKDEITWQTIIYDLIKTEQMDPWNIDVSLLTQKYIELLKSLQKHDFRISGKVVLAAAILLKIKSTRWIKEDIANLDNMFLSVDGEQQDALLDGFDDITTKERIETELIPRTPMPRKRKVSIYDLVNALEKALEVKQRRILRDIPIMDIRAPIKKKDITLVIKEVYQKINVYFKDIENQRLTFSMLAPSDSREDKIYTFIPLLHLTNQRKVDLEQYQTFGEIEITLNQKIEPKEIIPPI